LQTLLDRTFECVFEHSETKVTFKKSLDVMMSQAGALARKAIIVVHRLTLHFLSFLARVEIH